MSEVNNNQAQDLSELLQIRRDKLADLQRRGKDPFKITKYDVSHHSEEVKKAVAELEGKTVSVAGRMMSKRVMGKASFCHVQDLQGNIQIYVARDMIGEEAYADFKKFDIGDIIGVKGEVFVTKTGETSIRASEVVLLSKSLQILPEKYHGLTNVDLRYRQRYTDLIMNPDVKDTFIKRSKMISCIRRYLDAQGFIEVETPMLVANAGGAAARPFETHYNALDEDVRLRISLELYLKRLIVGGLERVYEIGRVFRNEGVDTRHNPEFTLMELYQAYTDYHGMMDLTENMFRYLAHEVCGSTVITYGENEIDLGKPFERLTMIDAVKRYAGVDFDAVPDTEAAKKLADERGIAYEARHQKGDILNMFFEEYCEDKLIQPTFIMDHPVDVSPLTKRKPDKPDYVERFELFVNGWEMCNAYSELNDPIDQRERFKAQDAAAAAGDEEANHTDEDFLNALEIGMPPTGGIGYGIDGYCCEVGDKLRETSDKPINYAGIAIKGLLFHYHPTSATVIVDGVEHKYKKVWLAPTMNGRYYGGGMIPTPKQDRLNKEHTVSVMVYYGSGKIKSLAVFPSIFKGEHVNHKEMVEVLSGKEITVRFDSPAALQVDGETIIGVTEYSVRTGKAAEKLNPAEAFVCA